MSEPKLNHYSNRVYVYHKQASELSRWSREVYPLHMCCSTMYGRCFDSLSTHFTRLFVHQAILVARVSKRFELHCWGSQQHCRLPFSNNQLFRPKRWGLQCNMTVFINVLQLAVALSTHKSIVYMATPIHQSSCRLSLCRACTHLLTNNSVPLCMSESCWVFMLFFTANLSSLLPFCFASAVLFVLVISSPLEEFGSVNSFLLHGLVMFLCLQL